MSPKRRLTFIVSASIFVFSALSLVYGVFLSATEETAVKGGLWREGMVGQPISINPVFPGNDIDRDISALIFADLDEMAEIKAADDNREWTVRLKEGLKWQDGEKITSDDIIFTAETIGNPDSRSPLFQSFAGAAASRVSELEVKFSLPSPYVFFETTLKKMKIIPKHVFGNIPANNFYLSRYILEPVGSGPYKFISFDKKNDGFITEYALVPNDYYFQTAPYIKKIIVRFFSNEKDLVAAYNGNSIDGAIIDDPENLAGLLLRHRIKPLEAPRYFAVFINQSLAENLKNIDSRRLLNSAINREKIVADAFKGFALPINGLLENIPLLPSKKTFDDSSTELNLSFPSSPTLEKVAERLKSDWEAVGFKINLAPLGTSEILEAIRTRNYELLLFGNNLTDPTDLYSFWHSSNRFFPGTNLSLYKNERADNLMEKIRSEKDEARRADFLSSLEKIINEDAPALFLYSPDYTYVVSPKLRGFSLDTVVTPDERFNRVENWYVKTARKFRSSAEAIEKSADKD